MDELSIRIEIAGRAYPLTIHPDEERNVRQAVTELNESMERLRANYPLTDKQDLLAMAALEVSVRALIGVPTEQLALVEREVVRLEEQVQAALSRRS